MGLQELEATLITGVLFPQPPLHEEVMALAAEEDHEPLGTELYEETWRHLDIKCLPPEWWLLRFSATPSFLRHDATISLQALAMKYSTESVVRGLASLKRVLFSGYDFVHDLPQQLTCRSKCDELQIVPNGLKPLTARQNLAYQTPILPPILSRHYRSDERWLLTDHSYVRYPTSY